MQNGRERVGDSAEVLSLEKLSGDAYRWVSGERDRLRAEARPLDAEELRRLQPFFSEELLREVRIRLVPRLENPEFMRDLLDDGETLPLDFRDAAGLALIDTVAAVEPRVRVGTRSWYELLFHELVHVAQYRHLGTRKFVETYVDALLVQGLSYRQVPHEAQAYALQRRYQNDPQDAFSVMDEVELRFDRD